MAIGLSHGGDTIYRSSAPSQELLVGTLKGIDILERHEAGWRVAHRALTDLHISSIVIEPESGMIFAGAFQGSVHASADGGRTWDRRDVGLTQDDVYSLASVRRQDGVRLYLGTEPAHLFVSDDLGLRWTELPALRSVPSVPEWTFPAPPHLGHLKGIVFDPDIPSTMYACIEQGALLKSIDGGESWTELALFPEAAFDVHRLIIDPTNTRNMYVTTGFGFYISLDGGASWEQRTGRDSEVGGYPDGLVLHPQQPQLMFMGAAQQNPGAWRESHFAGARVSRSRDGGRNWEILQSGLPDKLQASIEALCLEDCGDSFSVFVGTTAGEVYNSEDGGEHWSLVTSGLAPISKGGHYRNLAAAQV